MNRTLPYDVWNEAVSKEVLQSHGLTLLGQLHRDQVAAKWHRMSQYSRHGMAATVTHKYNIALLESRLGGITKYRPRRAAYVGLL